MRRHIALMAIATVAVTTMSFGTAPAGQYSQEASILQAAYGTGTFQGGGYGFIFIAKLQGGEFFAPGHVLPQDGTPDAPVVYGSFPNLPSGSQEAARYVGCIGLINAKRQFDGGCKVIKPSSATFDPALRSGAIAFSVESKVEGYAVSATAFLSATTDPQPVPTHEETINGQPVTGYNVTANGTPLRIKLASQVAYRRTAKLLGSVRSDVISGGGPFKKVNKAEMYGGIAGQVVIDRSRPACTNGSKPGEMPNDGPPPSVGVPDPNEFEPPTAEKPMPTFPTVPINAKFCPNDV